MEPTAPQLMLYVQVRKKHYEERGNNRARSVARQREQWRLLADRHRRERADIFRGSWKGKGALLNATRSVLAARQAQEKAALRERQQLARAARRWEKGRFPSYEEWLRERHRSLAEQWRHRERRPATIEGATFEPPAPLDIRAFSAVRDGWKVHYHRSGSRGAPAFTDRGQTIDIYDSQRRESVLAALQLSAQKWATIIVRGNAEFKRICVELAAEYGFKITNPDLQQSIAAERQRRRTGRAPDAAGQTRAQPEPTSLAGIYRRHLAEIVREQPQRGADLSRLDAEVAVRMSLTGHSPQAIAAAIKETARMHRPNERRDWDSYARRAASYPLSPPGERMRAQLGDRVPKFIRLEGRESELDLARGRRGPLRHL
jgi:hypothetical protein